MAVMRVATTLSYDVDGPAEVAFQVAVAGPVTSELLTVTLDGAAVEVTALDGTHLVSVGSGRLVLAYTADLPGRREPPAPPSALDRLVALRPSRYCPSDRLAGYATDRFGTLAGVHAVRAIEAHVHRHVTYTPGASGPTTDAADTLLAGQGVCRDYAHLVAALCRAVDVPARVAAVYAPGLDPMDFHLVTETLLDGTWWVWDATRLAARGSLARIATGRDAADVAFATVLAGRLDPVFQQITATTAGDLPSDDHTALVALPG